MRLERGRELLATAQELGIGSRPQHQRGPPVKVKIFQSSNPGEVEDKTNEWLESQGPAIVIDHTRFAIAKEGATLFAIAIFYTERAGSPIRLPGR
jgi:hypothetical protein